MSAFDRNLTWDETLAYVLIKNDWSKKISKRAKFDVRKGLKINSLTCLLCLVSNALQQRLLFWIFILCFVKGLSKCGVTPEGRVLIEMRVVKTGKRRVFNFSDNFEVMLTRLRCLTLCNELRCMLESWKATRTIIDTTPRPPRSLTESRRWVLRKMMLFEIDYHKFKQPSNVHPITSSR